MTLTSPRLFLRPQNGIFLAFGIYALSVGAIFPRLGDMQHQMGIGEGMLGMSIIGAALGVQLSLFFASRILQVLGFRLVMLLGVPIIGGAEMISTLSAGPLMFFICLFIAGLAIGVVEVAVNVEADLIEGTLKRRIMNRCHAFWSLGFFGAGLSGALLAQFYSPIFWHMAGFLGVTSAMIILLLAHYRPATQRLDEQADTAIFAYPTKPILMLVALTLSAMLLEGAGTDWSVIFMRDIFSTPPFISGMAFALGALSQFFVRFFADRFVDQYGPEKITSYSVIALGIGVILVTFAPFPLIALGGFVLLGAGNAVIFPLAISAAAQRTDRPASVNVAAVAQLSFIVFLLAPPFLGIMAEQFGIRSAFGICFPLVILSWFSVKSLRAPQ